MHSDVSLNVMLKTILGTIQLITSHTIFQDDQVMLKTILGTIQLIFPHTIFQDDQVDL